jgi:hypothetical protein
MMPSSPSSSSSLSFSPSSSFHHSPLHANTISSCPSALRSGLTFLILFVLFIAVLFLQLQLHNRITRSLSFSSSSPSSSCSIPSFNSSSSSSLSSIPRSNSSFLSNWQKIYDSIDCTPLHPKGVIYNRIPKAGSSSLLSVINKNAALLKFRHKSSTNYIDFNILNRATILNLCSSPERFLFDKHLFYQKISPNGARY